MRYLLLIYGEEGTGPEEGSEEYKEMFRGYYQFNEELGDANLGGAALESVDTATTVRVRQGETIVTDGPFAETKEQLGGYYLVEAADLDGALAMAAKIPGAEYGSIEVRPIWEIPATEMP